MQFYHLMLEKINENSIEIYFFSPCAAVNVDVIPRFAQILDVWSRSLSERCELGEIFLPPRLGGCRQASREPKQATIFPEGMTL